MKEENIQEKILEIQELFLGIGLEKLSILLGLGKNYLQNVISGSIKPNPKLKNILYKYENNIDEFCEIIDQNKHKVQYKIKNKLEMKLKEIKNVQSMIRLKNYITNNINGISKDMSYVSGYMQDIKNITTFKKKNLKDENDNIIKIEFNIYISVKDKLNSSLKKYDDNTIQRIINSMLYEKSNQFLYEGTENTIYDFHKIDKMINEFNKIEKEFKELNIKPIKKQIENMKKKYGINKKHILKCVKVSKNTVNAMEKEISVSTKQYKYSTKVKKLYLNPNKLSEKLNLILSEEEKLSFQKRIECDGFKILNSLEVSFQQLIVYYQELSKVIQIILNTEKSNGMINLKELINENTLYVNDKHKNEISETMTLNLYEYVEKKLRKLSEKYNEYSLDEIINTLLEKKLMQYVEFNL